jgi:cytochrome c oxidase assembly protein subunit 15
LKEQAGYESSGAPKPYGLLYWLAMLVAFETLVLLVAGALVTSNEAGDSVPDWPLSFGRWLIHSDYFVSNVRYEYSHRFIAGVVGVSTFILAVWAWFTERRRWVRNLALLAFAGVVIQALIGGVRVLFPAYKPYIAIPHALIAQSFFGTIIAIAVFASRGWWTPREVRRDTGAPQVRRLAVLTVAAILVQLVLGAGFRHQAFGIIPHIVGAVVVATLVVWTSVTVLRRHGQEEFLSRPAITLIVLLVVQVGLGILAYLARLASLDDPQPLEPMISLTVAHLAVGALTLATMIVLTLRCYRTLAPGREQAEGASQARVSSARRATV